MNEVFAFIGRLLDLILTIVPHDVAKQLLDEAAVRRANAIANAAEAVKFGPDPGREG